MKLLNHITSAICSFLMMALISCTEEPAPIAVTSVTLDSSSITLVEGETYELMATVSPSNAENKKVIWTSSNSSVASVKEGVVTALKAGKATVTAKSDDGGKTATCEVTVNAKVYPVTGVTLDKTSYEMTEGDEFTLTATVNPSNATNKNVSWKSSNTSVATVSDGKVTALKAGSATITVTTEDGSKTATCEVTVNAKVYPVTGVTLDKTSYEMTEGDEFTLTATVNPSNATNKNVSWKSSNTSVATVSDGKVTALKVGSATITVTTEDGSKTATCEVTVNAKVYPVTGVTLDKTSYEMTEGDEFTLTATVNPSNATNKNVSWKSSNTSVATVSNGKVTAVKAGSATITVTTEDGGKIATCSVTVNAKVYPVTSVSLNKSTATLTEGETLTLIATVNPSNATNKNVSWKSSNTSVATVSDGKVTALKAGSATITVTTEDGSKTATCEVTVNAKVYPVTGVTLDKTSYEMTEGDEFTLTATVNPSNATNKNVSWKSSNTSVATVSNGKVTAVKAGSATITVTTEDGGKIATCSVTVNAKVYPVTGVTLDKTSYEMTEGDEFTLTATVNPSNATNKNVSWKSSNTSVATVSDGKVTALKAGSATITVTTEDGSKTATCEVTVNAKVYPVTGVTLDKTSYEMTEGDEFTLTATVNPSNATNKNVSWKSSNTSVATVSNGKVTALKAGTTTITVTTEDDSKTATCSVTVNAKVYPVTGVSLDKTTATLTEGETLTLTATVNPDNATNKNVSWKSSNTSVATVSNGKVTALKAGTTTITVTTEDGSKTATCSVTVNAKVYPVTGVSLNKTTATLTEGETLTLTATVNPSNATNKSVSWKSSNTSVATVSNGKVTALKAGTTTITVTTEDGSKTATCSVTVNAKVYPVTGVSLNKTTATLTEGETLTLTATVNPSNATNKSVSWKSSNTSVATVSNGKVTALKAGTTTITVTTEDGSKTATCSVTVNAKVYPVTGVSLNKTTATLTEGETLTLTATVNPSNATNKSVSWKSSNTSVATVSNGKVTALKAGTAKITVTTADGGKTATCTVTVNAKVYPVTGVSLSKTTAEIVVGNKLQLKATINPSNATNKNVSWTSSNTSVVTVNSSGEVSSLMPGSANIVVTTEDGNYTAICKITVVKRAVSGGNESTEDEDWGI